jgi:hypothetical protein
MSILSFQEKMAMLSEQKARSSVKNNSRAEHMTLSSQGRHWWSGEDK